jgi:protein-disulfide isomerase
MADAAAFGGRTGEFARSNDERPCRSPSGLARCRDMKIITSLALLAVLASCEQQKSRLDSISSKEKIAAQPTAPGATNPTPPAGEGSTKFDGKGSVEERLAKVEAALNRSGEALDYITNAFAQQKAQQKAQQEQAERDEPAPDAVFAVDVAEDVKGGQVDGPATAAVTIVKAFDFACPYCQRVSQTMEDLVKEYNGKVRVVYSNLLIHPVARPAHLAACAAGKQGKYKEFKNVFWDKGFQPYVASQGRDQSTMGEDAILTMVKDVGIDPGKLKSDMNSPECDTRIKNDMKILEAFRVQSTPSFFINGKFLNGAMPKDRFKEIIDEQLKVVEKSGVPAAEYYDKVVIAKGEKKFRSKMEAKPN